MSVAAATLRAGLGGVNVGTLTQVGVAGRLPYVGGPRSFQQFRRLWSITVCGIFPRAS